MQTEVYLDVEKFHGILFAELPILDKCHVISRLNYPLCERAAGTVMHSI